MFLRVTSSTRRRPSNRKASTVERSQAVARGRWRRSVCASRVSATSESSAGAAILASILPAMDTVVFGRFFFLTGSCLGCWIDRWRSTSDRDEQQGGAEEKLQNREAAIYTHTSISVRMMHGRGSFRCCLLASQPKSPSSLLAVLPSLSRTRRYMITHVHGAPTTTPRGCSPAQAATRPPPRHWRRRGGPPSS